MNKQGYIFITSEGTIREFVTKLSPFVKPQQGERILRYIEPDYNPMTHTLRVVTPILSVVEFIIEPKV